MVIKEKFALNITEAGKVLGVSRSTMYKLLELPDFPSFKIGARTLISAEGLEDWVRRQAAEKTMPTVRRAG